MRSLKRLRDFRVGDRRLFNITSQDSLKDRAKVHYSFTFKTLPE